MSFWLVWVQIKTIMLFHIQIGFSFILSVQPVWRWLIFLSHMDFMRHWLIISQTWVADLKKVDISPSHTHILESLLLSFTDTQTQHPWGVCLPALAVLTVVSLTGGVVLVQGTELWAGRREAVFLVGALEAGQNTLTKQILPRLHLQEMVETHKVWLLELLFALPYEKKKKTLGGVQVANLFWGNVRCFEMLLSINSVVSPDP